MSDVYDGTESADYYTGTTAAAALPISAPADTPATMLGLLRTLSGESRPIVYLPKLAVNLSTIKTAQSRRDLMLCTIQEDISIEHVLGDENDTDVYRVSTITLREII